MSPSVASSFGCGNGDPDWAIGAYSNKWGLPTEEATWTNLPSSFSMTGVTAAQYMVNVPVDGSGSFPCNGTNLSLSGFLFQDAILYYPSGETYPYPEATLVLFTDSGAVLYNVGFYGTNLGSGQFLETLTWTTYNSVTGWWFEIHKGSATYYLMPVDTTSTSGIYFNTSYNYSITVDGCSSIPYVTINTIGTKSTEISVGLPNSYTYNPSIAMEIHESTPGNFSSDNPNFAAEANVTQGGFDTYATTGTQDFNIGLTSPPTNPSPYGSGLEDTVNGATSYYDELGTSKSISSRYSSHWSLWTPRATNSGGSSILDENYICSGSTCSGSYYLTTSVSGCPSGSTCSVSPSSGYYTDGAQVQVQASISGGCGNFKNWSGSGYGWYSGSSNPGTVTMDGNNVVETANFLNACTPQG